MNTSSNQCINCVASVNQYLRRAIMLFSFLLLIPLQAYAAVDMFLEIEGIKGESKDNVYTDTIDVLAWTEGVSNSISNDGTGGTSGGGKASFNDLSVTKYLDKSSVPLRVHLASGKSINKVTLYVRKAGVEPLTYFIIEMTKVLVSSVSSGGSGGEDRLTENVTFNFSTIKWSYTPQADDGSGGGKIEAGWDLEQDQKL